MSKEFKRSGKPFAGGNPPTVDHGLWTMDGGRLSFFLAGALQSKPLLIHLFFLTEEVEVELGNLKGTEITVGVYAGGEFDVVFHDRINYFPTRGGKGSIND